VSLVRGNVLLVDHGDDVPDQWSVPGTTQYGCCACEGAVQDVTRPPGDTGHVLDGSPLTWAEPLPPGPAAPVCQLLARDPRQALPQLRVSSGLADSRDWQARSDLLESAPDDRDYVVEMDDDGAAHLRFGDGTLGQRPDAGDVFTATLRLGNGPAGNVGRDSIVWLALVSDVPPPGVVPRNPMAAAGGTAPESLAEVKQYVPGAFRAKPLRAIVADDYAQFVDQQPGVQDAACRMAWTGSWFEASVAVDPLGADMLDPAMARSVKRALWPYRRIGHDLAVRGARYVPVIVELSVCVLPDFLVAHVKAALIDRFRAGLRHDGQPGFFHPDRLLLGSAVLESALIAEAQAVTGVAHVEVVTLARADGGASGDVPADGKLWMGPMEIAQVDSDPDHPDHGSITFTMRGGR
jgi:predicted phage baseplate assembly protein